MFLYGLLGTTYIIFYYLCAVYNNLIVKYQLCLNKLFSVSVSVSVYICIGNFISKLINRIFIADFNFNVPMCIICLCIIFIQHTKIHLMIRDGSDKYAAGMFFYRLYLYTHCQLMYWMYHKFLLGVLFLEQNQMK